MVIALEDDRLAEIETYYDPQRIDSILKNWPAFVSRSEGMRSTQPEALRPAKGRRGDALRSADVTADVSQAMVACLSVGGAGWRAVEARRWGWTFGMIAVRYHVTKQSIHESYWLAITQMAAFLGWVEPPKDEDDASQT